VLVIGFTTISRKNILRHGLYEEWKEGKHHTLSWLTIQASAPKVAEDKVGAPSRPLQVVLLAERFDTVPESISIDGSVSPCLVIFVTV